MMKSVSQNSDLFLYPFSWRFCCGCGKTSRDQASSPTGFNSGGGTGSLRTIAAIFPFF